MNKTTKKCSGCDFLEIVSGGGWCHSKSKCVKKDEHYDNTIQGVPHVNDSMTFLYLVWIQEEFTSDSKNLSFIREKAFNEFCKNIHFRAAYNKLKDLFISEHRNWK